MVQNGLFHGSEFDWFIVMVDGVSWFRILTDLIELIDWLTVNNGFDNGLLKNVMAMYY